MNPQRSRVLTGGRVLAMLALGLGACTSGDSGAPLGIEPSFTGQEPPPGHRQLIICKVGSDATFDIDVSGAPSFSVFVSDGQCVTAWTFDPNVSPHTGQQIVVSEMVIGPSVVLDSIIKDSVFGIQGTNPPEFNTIRLPTIIGTNTVTNTISGGLGAILTYYNHIEEPPPPPPPGGGEGCTPGYWKQRHHFDSWPAPYTPNTLFSAVFEDAFPGKTLLQVLAQGGGGLKALGRHTVAALLNGGNSDVNFDMNAQGVIDAFNAVFPGGDYEGQKNIFAVLNEQGCPLN